MCFALPMELKNKYIYSGKMNILSQDDGNINIIKYLTCVFSRTMHGIAIWMDVLLICCCFGFVVLAKNKYWKLYKIRFCFWKWLCIQRNTTKQNYGGCYKYVWEASSHSVTSLAIWHLVGICLKFKSAAGESVAFHMVSMHCMKHITYTQSCCFVWLGFEDGSSCRRQ